MELENLGIGTIRKERIAKAKNILPKKLRDDPFATMPTIEETEMQNGMYGLMNRGMIPKDVDVSPAFERGHPPFRACQSKIELKTPTKPKHLQPKLPMVKLNYKVPLPDRTIKEMQSSVFTNIL